MLPKATNEYEATLVRDSLYAASSRGQFPMTDSVEHKIETAFHWEDYALLHAYSRFLTIDYLPWLIDASISALRDMGAEHPEVVLTTEHMDAYKAITTVIIELYGNTSTARGFMDGAVSVAFSDLKMAAFIPDIISSRKAIFESELIAILDEMRAVHPSLAEGAL